MKTVQGHTDPSSLLPSSPPSPPSASRRSVPPPAPPRPPSASSDSCPPLPPARPSRDGRSSLPFSFPPLFFGPGNASSTSLAQSTAEGRPIPLDDGTAAHRTSALRELNSNYPSPVSRQRYAKSAGAQNSTYSQPVIVRTYSGPSPSQHPHPPASRSHAGHYRPPSASRAGSRRIPLRPSSSTTAPFFGSASRPTGVGFSSLGKHANGSVLSMARAKAKKKLPWQWKPGRGSSEPDEAKLPPLEAYSFKGIMASLEGTDLEASLDRISEICARSKYSLSNQYEAHVAPHGSGTAFVTPGQSSSGRKKGNGHKREAGPTLQAIQSDDDEGNPRTHRKRRSGGRRRSVAYGTLETIMSSSRSSEEDKTKKKSAAELAAEVRGRAARKGSDPGARATANGEHDPHGSTMGKKEDELRRAARQKSTAFAHAVIDSTRHAAGTRTDASSPRNSASALVSEPALPQTSSTHLEIRTAPDMPFEDVYGHDSPPQSPVGSGAESPLTADLPHVEAAKDSNAGVLSGFTSWMPWRASEASLPARQRGAPPPSHAEGSLRDLLKTVDGKSNKGKGVEREI